MKRRLRLLLPILLLGLTLVLSSCGKSVAEQDVYTTTKANKTIIWGVKADTRLFGLMNIKDSEIQGFDIDIAKAVTKAMYGKDAKAELVQVTSDTRVPLLKAGNIDAVIATMTITPDRKKVLDFSTPYFNAGQSLLVKSGSPIKSVKDLKKGTKVIGVQGSNSVLNIKKAAPEATVLQLSDYAQAFTALKSGQGDALTTDNGILYGMSKQDPNYVVVGGSFTKEPYGIAVNKGQTKFVKAIDQALIDIKKDGTYAKLVNKWFGEIPGFSIKEVGY
ncbi:transporter substrate-binding domain-containing protein [Lacticaseibacillus saniviri]|uniref:transporter substrate-binding domain-containing protein n=1 Tax=Lacticaseibacillus saniviri TaxID=931533 RepID=UPI0006CF5853|nr:transporter substrate-binding domain-containing protein [Lacticaseibacillus saniviri]MCG4282606.1 transporter substrate-binding domain-containing protein [Lacticaseibacillus saniviri]